jgi:hypothetical protein
VASRPRQILSLIAAISWLSNPSNHPARDPVSPRALTVSVLGLRALHHTGAAVVSDRPSAFLFEDIGSLLKGGAKVCQRQLVGSLATWAARPRHLFSAPSMPAFSVASRLSNSSDTMRSDILKATPQTRWSPVERTRFKVCRQTPPARALPFV